MNEVKSAETTTRHHTISVTGSPFITADSVMAFARRLREDGMDPGARIICGHSEQTRHLVSLRAESSRTTEIPRAAEVPGE
jgi:hypothetical protein